MCQGHPCQACYSPWTPLCISLSTDYLGFLQSAQAATSSCRGLKDLQWHIQQLCPAIREVLATFLPEIPDRQRSGLLVSQDTLLHDHSHCSIIGDSSCHHRFQSLWSCSPIVVGLKNHDLNSRPHCLASESHRHLRRAGAPTLASRFNLTRPLFCCYRISQGNVSQLARAGTLLIFQ